MARVYFLQGAASVPWGFRSRTPGNHDGPGYTSSLPYSHGYDFDDTPYEVAPGTDIQEPSTSPEPIPAAMNGAKLSPLLPVDGSGTQVRSAFGGQE